MYLFLKLYCTETYTNFYTCHKNTFSFSHLFIFLNNCLCGVCRVFFFSHCSCAFFAPNIFWNCLHQNTFCNMGLDVSLRKGFFCPPYPHSPISTRQIFLQFILMLAASLGNVCLVLLEMSKGTLV